MQKKANELTKIVSTGVERFGRRLYALQPQGLPKFGPYVFVFLATDVMVWSCQFLPQLSQLIVFPVFLFFVVKGWCVMRLIESQQGVKLLAPSQIPDFEFPPILVKVFPFMMFGGSLATLMTEDLQWGRLLLVPMGICLGLFFWKDTDSKFF